MQALALPGDIVLYVDGGCNNNGNRIGAYAFVCIELDNHPFHSNKKHGKLLFGGGKQVINTTNNIMEMTSVLEGLKKCVEKGITPKIVITDSQYVQKGLSEWMWGWKINDWRNSAGKPVKNKELWEELLKWWKLEICTIHIKGHCGVFWNEYCDQTCGRLIRGTSKDIT